MYFYFLIFNIKPQNLAISKVFAPQNLAISKVVPGIQILESGIAY